MVNLEDIARNLQSGRARETSALVSQAIEEHYTIDTIIKQGFIAALISLKERRRRNEIEVPEISMALRALNRGIRQIKLAIAASPSASASDVDPKGTVIIGTAEGDAEETAKNIIAVLLECRGLKVIDLGTSVRADQFINTAKTENAALIICSAARVPAMTGMKALVQTASAAGIRERTKIMLTGAPVTEQYCRIIGADRYAPDASAAAEIAVAVCGS
ncbi:corrinoid methyltransferase [Spirochaetia bacterium]|nr:corrinoid methyltransferase [Spirochaetia bacterium]